MATADEQHPLLQSVVINCMLGYVPKLMWRTCRLVCKSWHDELLPRWRKQTKVRIGGLGKSELSIDGDTTYSTDHDVSSFVEAYQPDNDVHQLEKYPVRFMETISGQVTIEPTQIQSSFWKLCGPWLHELHFHGVMFKDVNYLKVIIFELTPNLQKLEFSGCDNLKEVQNEAEGSVELDLARSKLCENVQSNLKMLKISSKTSSRNGSYRSKFPVDFMDVFSVFTNIEDLSLEKFYSFDTNDGPKLTYILDVIRTIRESQEGHSNDKLNIKKLHLKDIGMGFTPTLVAQLCALSLPLEDLEVLTDNKDRCLERLLSKYSTLKKLYLKIFNCEPLNQATFELRVLPETLTELSFNGLVFKDWSFLAFTPNLTKLVVILAKHEKLIELPRNLPMNRTRRPLLKFVTTFVYKTGKVVPFVNVEVLTRIMPNVTDLTLSVDCEGFRIVCDAWTKLTFWEINYARVNEETFIANISKLQCLTYLGVKVADNENDGTEMMVEFGDDSIENGFLTLPKLQKLSITILKMSILTMTWLKKLYEKIPDTDNVYVVRERWLDRQQVERCGRLHVREKFQLKDIVDENFPETAECKNGIFYHNITPTKFQQLLHGRQPIRSPCMLSLFERPYNRRNRENFPE